MFHLSILPDSWSPRDPDHRPRRRHLCGTCNVLCWENSLCLTNRRTRAKESREETQATCGHAPLEEWAAFPLPSGQGRQTYVHEGRVDVVAALPIDGDEERQAAVRGQDVHAAVLLMVPGQKCDAAVFHPQRWRHHVQGLHDSTGAGGQESAGRRAVSPSHFRRSRFLQLTTRQMLPAPYLVRFLFLFSPVGFGR